MPDFFATNTGTVSGGVGWLTVACNFDAGIVGLLNLGGDLATVHNSTFDGPPDKSTNFSGIEPLSHIDGGGGPERIHTGNGNDSLSHVGLSI